MNRKTMFLLTLVIVAAFATSAYAVQGVDVDEQELPPAPTCDADDVTITDAEWVEGACECPTIDGVKYEKSQDPSKCHRPSVKDLIFDYHMSIREAVTYTQTHPEWVRPVCIEGYWTEPVCEDIPVPQSCAPMIEVHRYYDEASARACNYLTGPGIEPDMLRVDDVCDCALGVAGDWIFFSSYVMDTCGETEYEDPRYDLEWDWEPTLEVMKEVMAEITLFSEEPEPHDYCETAE